ncbi:MAG TPA: hypothetical protein VGQ09_18840 [Chitinophagaceae bacterium]|jgi:hypothetical protein|nr:hypothetical protein [Chitinophagaceae bacterium]
MKKIIVILLFVFAINHLKAQEQNTSAAKLAHHIADKMKDTLGLDNQQRAKIFQVNIDLYKQKTMARGSSQDRVVVGRDLQRIEGTRDSLYRVILTATQYELYLQKKRHLITNN